MTAAVARPPVGSGDRLAATIAFSLILHGVLLLGVGFGLDAAAPITPTLDVILVQTRSDAAPDEADFLAQSSQQGGGDRDEARRPREPQPSSTPSPSPGVAPVPVAAQAPPPEPTPAERVLTAPQASQRVPPPQESRTTQARPQPTGREVVEADLEMARLAAEIDRQQELYAKKPRRKFVSASTREYAYAGYLRAWVQRVERVGNLNYPDEARRRRLSGAVRATVAVRRDGTVEGIVINESSGSALLDEAVLRIVRLSQPFQRLPDEEDVDVLHITRTWRFLPGGTLRDE
ncbi:energy transducer TonB [Coralloluteibacterium stylophorae]|uniref:Energy transducer TonB n=1 Tax=Coralloluteibacterium stylophorae TaxID=1776034 RepID=A0A8J8AYL6_9GAMM|nr:energy transducer TonB [Coralloluteibacterium stylophorae]MBS7456085.1 energy transducer TonB [Coralloluteibacterium stylophorae]